MTDEVKAYQDMVKGICDLYHTEVEKEHEFVHEFFEGGIPLFKLVYAPAEGEDKSCIIVTFHLDVDSVYAIQWYTRLQDIFPPLRITHCYYRDDAGATYMGEDAEVVKMYKVEQAVISEWIRENQEMDEDVLEKQVVFEQPKKEKKVYSSREAALREFNLMRKGKKEEYH